MPVSKKYKMMSAADFMEKEAEHVLDIYSLSVDFNRTMMIVELDYGVVIETIFTDDDGTTLTETLFGIDRELFTLIGRWRVGPEHCEWKSYPRDSFYCLGGRVRL